MSAKADSLFIRENIREFEKIRAIAFLFEASRSASGNRQRPARNHTSQRNGLTLIGLFLNVKVY